MRIFAVSDPHTDFAENRRRLKGLSSTRHLQDAVVVAGDIADDLKIIAGTLPAMRSTLGKVFSFLSYGMSYDRSVKAR
jgi:hypothetical protein